MLFPHRWVIILDLKGSLIILTIENPIKNLAFYAIELIKEG
jgi:hypothetical protein